MKKILSTLLVAAMLLSLVVVVAVPASAADGEWTVYATSSQYTEEFQDDPSSIPGYRYTGDGVQMIPADWSSSIPFGTIQTKDPVTIKDGVYMEVRIDEFSWDTGDGWININFWDSQSIEPASADYGEGVQTLIRPAYNEAKDYYYLRTIQWIKEGFSPATGKLEFEEPQIIGEDGTITLCVELKYDGSKYALTINGMEAPESITSYMAEKFAEGEAYVGVAMRNTTIGGTLGCTITKFGTDEKSAIAPDGDDSLEPENFSNEKAPIADASTIPAGEPCIVLTGDRTNSATKSIVAGAGDTVRILDDFTTRLVTVNDAYTCVTYNVKNEISYDIDDFPFFLVLTKDYCTCEDPADCYVSEELSMYLMAGDCWAAEDKYKVPMLDFDLCWDPIDVAEGEKAGRYFYHTYDFSDDVLFETEGRINGLRLDTTGMKFQEAGRNSFDVAFAAFFRSAEDAERYVYNYLGLEYEGGDDENTTESVEVTTESVEITTESVEQETEDQTEKQTEKEPEKQTEKETETPKTSGGCGSFIGAGALTVVALVAVCGAISFKKKD